MTSQFDLASFIQSVVYEDQQLDTREDQPADPRSGEDDAGRSRHKLNLTKRQMSFISPRLGVLNNIPFVLPFENRVQIFRQFVDNDRTRLGFQRDRFTRGKRHKAIIRRDHLAEDAYGTLNGLGSALKGSIEIVFKDEHGFEESGIDGGGLFKELLTSLTKEAFDTDRGLWLETSQHELYPNPHAYARGEDSLSWYQFMGRILGKALYEGILVEVRFAAFFLAKWLGKQSYLDDLASLDEELYKGLVQLKNYEGNVEDLSLNFTVTEDEFGVSREVPLVPNGADVPVTNENRTRYILLTAHYKLNSSSAKQCEAFFAGLSDIIPERFLRLFNQQELRVLVGGVEQEIDVDDLKANTFYGGEPDHRVVHREWVARSLTPLLSRCRLGRIIGHDQGLLAGRVFPLTGGQVRARQVRHGRPAPAPARVRRAEPALRDPQRRREPGPAAHVVHVREPAEAAAVRGRAHAEEEAGAGDQEWGWV